MGSWLQETLKDIVDLVELEEEEEENAMAKEGLECCVLFAVG